MLMVSGWLQKSIGKNVICGMLKSYYVQSEAIYSLGLGASVS